MRRQTRVKSVRSYCGIGLMPSLVSFRIYRPIGRHVNSSNLRVGLTQAQGLQQGPMRLYASDLFARQAIFETLTSLSFPYKQSAPYSLQTIVGLQEADRVEVNIIATQPFKRQSYKMHSGTYVLTLEHVSRSRRIQIIHKISHKNSVIAQNTKVVYA